MHLQIERGSYPHKSGSGHLSPLSQYKRLKERGFKVSGETVKLILALDLPQLYFCNQC